MFNNIGNKIKDVARTVTWILIVLSIVCGALTWKSMADIRQGGLGLVLFLVIGGLGSLVAWLGSLVLYGFGQLVDDASTIRRAITKAAKPGVGPAAQQPVAQQPVAQQPAPRQAVAQQPVHTAASGSGAPSAAGEDSPWRCPVCGALNAAGRPRCIKCSTNR